MKDNKYIELLKWGRDNIEGVKSEVLIEKLNELKLPSGYDGIQTSLNQFVKNIFYRAGDKYIPTFEAIFELQEHESLVEARKSSKNAMYIAIGALIVSIIVGIWQIILMYYSSSEI